MDLRKYKMNAGGATKTPQKRSKSKGDLEDSPTVRFEGQPRRSRGRSTEAGRSSIEEAAYANNIRKHMRDLDTGIADKVSLMKMLVIKCDEADQNFNRLR